MTTIRRPLSVATKILDAGKGIVEYVASDETLDSYREIIRVAGWRFTNFKKNAPFVDSHDYSTIEKQVGSVIEVKLQKDQLVETVQWAKEVKTNRLAQLGWDMTEAGHLKAVSVGFAPVDYVMPQDGQRFQAQLTELGIKPEARQPRLIYVEQEQLELSAVIIGANPNALLKAYKDGILKDADLDLISQAHALRETAGAALLPEHAALAQARARDAWLAKFQQLTNQS